ncbi:MAG: hypothetical protein HYR64_05010 [Fimbriimonas ginsengisoli]|uniref:Uncharacterized protein n=1 Tax=Fimbriimonas ginsengisoli TaxID=1005039 RepID=A0A931PWA7_FIMGI|nr:hypothetical protein [Fimbriimonas ginsengisoli]
MAQRGKFGKALQTLAAMLAVASMAISAAPPPCPMQACANDEPAPRVHRDTATPAAKVDPHACCHLGKGGAAGHLHGLKPMPPSKAQPKPSKPAKTCCCQASTSDRASKAPLTLPAIPVFTLAPPEPIALPGVTARPEEPPLPEVAQWPPGASPRAPDAGRAPPLA